MRRTKRRDGKTQTLSGKLYRPQKEEKKKTFFPASRKKLEAFFSACRSENVLQPSLPRNKRQIKNRPTIIGSCVHRARAKKGLENIFLIYREIMMRFKLKEN